MSPFRPDLVDVWVFRQTLAESGIGLEILLLRRSPGRILPGLWQCVSGSLEAGESVTAGALRELREETGFGPTEIEGFYDLDQVNQFHEPSVGAIVTSAIFAVRLRAGAEPVLSHEHDASAGSRPRRRSSWRSGPPTANPSAGSSRTCWTPSGPSGSS
jgi:8-oxo-dGTP pyrophosphatase MutT (NUDIX family)